MVLKLETELMVRESGIDGTLITSPEHVENKMVELKSAAQECFCILAMNAKQRLIEKHIVSLGTLTSALVHPREVFRCLLMCSAASVILVHNHPSGDPTPSAEDIKITRQLVSAGEIMGIKVLDHVILGDTAMSLRESGLVKF